MPGRYLLDTNIVIALFRSDPLVETRLRDEEEVYLSSVVLGELIYGARISGRPSDNLDRIAQFAADTPAFGCDAETADHYALIKAELRAKGRPIPENDLWIAAVTMQHNLILVTRDGHFAEIESLRREAW